MTNQPDDNPSGNSVPDEASRQQPAEGRRGCQLTLRQILLTAAIVAMVLGAAIWGIQRARENAQKAACVQMLRQLGLLLHGYHDRHKSLPPAYLTDSAGKPSLSWRVLADQHYDYNIDFRARMDFSKPWDDPKNATFLNGLGGGAFKCPSGGADPDITDYVAVTGPGTLWPGKEPMKLPRRSSGRSPILVIEWPKSDIHWAEPRDVTVEEFLDWFRSKPGPAETNHPGCILYVDAAGEVHELPTDTDPDDVRKLLIVEPQ